MVNERKRQLAPTPSARLRRCSSDAFARIVAFADGRSLTMVVIGRCAGRTDEIAKAVPVVTREPLAAGRGGILMAR